MKKNRGLSNHLPRKDLQLAPQPHLRLNLTAPILAVTFLLYGLVAVGILAVNMPPFQNPDEPNHFLRAAQLADGHMIGSRFSISGQDGEARLTAGALNDPAVIAAAAPFDRLKSYPPQKAARADWAPAIRWSQTRTMEDFWNTVMYPPAFYLPSAAGILIGRATHRTVLQTLVISRLLMGFAAVTVGAMAIALADGAAIWLFALLTLPMSLSLIASVSQDALMLGCSALAGALAVRALRHPDRGRWFELPVLVGVLTLLAMARPPYISLSFLLLALPKLKWRWRIACLGIVITGATLWMALMAATVLTYQSFFPGTNPAAQLALLLSDPLSGVRIAGATLSRYGHEYVVEFVGRLGWLNTSLPSEYHLAAQAMLAVAAFAAMLGLTGERVGAGAGIAIGFGMLVAAAGVFGANYLIWTPVANSVVEGVQGRYFLPIVLAGAGLLPSLGRGRWAPHFYRLLIAVAAFPAVSLAIVMQAVISRYYLN